MDHPSSEMEAIQNTWEQICDKFPVPKSLYRHQKDTISLLLRGESVFCGSPTGSGKTLAQLATVLFTSGCALVIPPLLTIELQMCQVCEAWGIQYLNLSAIEENSMGVKVAAEKPRILISSIEKISSPTVQKQLFDLKLEYISLDEAQVLDPETGWTQIRPYSSETWAFLRARFKCPFLLLSATMEEASLGRICANLDISREKVKVLYSNPDRANIYQQRRMMKHPIDVMNLRASLSFIVPAILDSKFKKCQIFCCSRFTTDIVSAWLRSELNRIQEHLPNSILVKKLTGDNTRGEKERVMELFKDGQCQVLICTDVAGMGLDVQDLNFSVNIGIPKSAWKMKQQSGRIGRGGERSLDITLIFPQKGSSAPEPSLRKAIKESNCMRTALNDLFVLSNPVVDYSSEPIVLDCQDAGCELLECCQCSLCRCCTPCADKCSCLKSQKDPNSVMESILGFGDDSYRLAKEILEQFVSSDESFSEEEEEETAEAEESSGPRE